MQFSLQNKKKIIYYALKSGQAVPFKERVLKLEIFQQKINASLLKGIF